MTRAQVMTRAWQIARRGQAVFGGNVKQYFAEALRMAWAEAKSMDQYNVRLIKKWFADKKDITGWDLDQSRVVRETEKAVQLECSSTVRTGKSLYWVPKSCFRTIDEYITDEQKSLEEDAREYARHPQSRENARQNMIDRESRRAWVAEFKAIA